MSILYFILTIILLIMWLGPYILIGVIVLIVYFLYMLIKERGSIYNTGGESSSTQKQVKAEKAAYHDYQGHKKSSQLPEHLQKVRRQHAELTHSISSNTTADVASNIPQTSGLKSDDQPAQTRQKPILLKETEDKTTSSYSTKQSLDIDNKPTQVIKESTEPPLDLSRAKDMARTLHERGDLESEIAYIKNVIQQCQNADYPCKYWELLLKIRKSERQKQKSIIISQIIIALQQKAACYLKYVQNSSFAINQPALQANQPHYALLQNAEYCKQRREHIADLHQEGKLEDEILFIKNVIDDYKSAGLPCTYWELLLRTRQHDKDVPYWASTYVYSASELSYANSAQKRFYSHFKEQFLKNIFIDVKGNLNYVYILMYDLADDYMCHHDYTLLKQQLDTLAEKYDIEERYIDNAIRQAVITVKQNDVIGNEKYIIFGKMEYIRIGNNDASFSVTRVHRFR